MPKCTCSSRIFNKILYLLLVLLYVSSNFQDRNLEYFFLSFFAAMKMLNPVALFRSASSRSSSSRFLVNSSSSRDEGYESSSDFSEEPCMYSGSHQSTLDRLFAWEKKLYEEVKVILLTSHQNFQQSLSF
jgi:hypothetical protein